MNPIPDIAQPSFQLLDDCFRTAMTEALDPDAAAQDLARQLLHPHLGCVLFFCSAEYPLERLATALEQHFGGVMLLGCTTAGEISAQGYGRGCISALGLDLRTFAVDCTLIQALDKGLRAYERIARLAAPLVAEDGYLVLCSCSHAADMTAFTGACLRGIGRAGRRAVLIHTGQAGADHPLLPQLAESGYLKALFFRL